MKHQRSINYISFSLPDYLIAMDGSLPTMNVSPAIISKNTSDNIVFTSFNRDPIRGQHIFCTLSAVHSNELHCVVPKLSFPPSVISICPCIQVHIYQCNISNIWFFCLYREGQFFRIPSLHYWYLRFSRLLSRITQHSSSYWQVRLKLFEHLIAGGYNFFQTVTSLNSWLDQLYITNHLQSFVSFNEMRLNTSDCWE